MILLWSIQLLVLLVSRTNVAKQRTQQWSIYDVSGHCYRPAELVCPSHAEKYGLIVLKSRPRLGALECEVVTRPSSVQLQIACFFRRPQIWSDGEDQECVDCKSVCEACRIQLTIIPPNIRQRRDSVRIKARCCTLRGIANSICPCKVSESYALRDGLE